MKRLARLAVTALLLAAGAAPAQLYYFGKNKVQTRDYRFQELETGHFRVLFYPGGESMAEFAARSAEKFYADLVRDLGVEIEFKIPLILYLSPTQFAETNVITDIIEEGVGGFSELFKNRIVLPFNGSYDDFHHVIGHEITHIFQFEMFYRSRLAALLGAVDEFQIPLWVLEGHAEFQSGWVNVENEIFMRDLVLNNRLVPLHELHDGYGYLVYREGESFYYYVEERYGRQKAFEFLHSLRQKRNLEATFAQVFGMKVDEFSAEWEKWLRMRYWPQVTGLAAFDTLAELVTDHRKDGSTYNTAPALSPSGTKIAFVSDRLEYVDLYVISALDGRVLRRLVRGERSGGFETMHLLRPGVAWSPDERTIAVVTRSAGRDNITLVDYPGGKVRRRIGVGLDAVYTPRFSPDGGRLVFVGQRNGFSDVYVVDVAGGEPERVTFDIYEDKDPVFSPSGDSIAFVSDRPDQGGEWLPGAYSLWLRDPGGKLHRLTEACTGLGHPEFAGNTGKLLFVAGDSARNLYVHDLASGKVTNRTTFLGEVSYPTVSSDGRKLAFAYFSNVGWDIATVLDPLERIPETTAGTQACRKPDTASFRRQGLDFERVKKARFGLSPDYAVGAASYSSYGGLAGLVNVAFSDMLGNHRFGLYTDIYGDIINSDLVLEYWLLPHRVDYGFTLFQYRETPYYAPGYAIVDRVNRGGQAIAGYPFDKFTRVEAGLTGYASQVSLYGFDQQGWYLDTLWWDRVFYASPALVFDNTYWTWQGPARGTRARIGADISFLSSRQFHDIYLDFRNYQRFGRRTVLATRIFGLGGFGRDADRYYLGGEAVRGYNWGEFYDDAGPGIALANLELRVPFIDRIKLAAPLPLEFGGIRGVVFADAGLVLRDSLRVWDAEKRRLDDLKLGVGAGIRVQVSYFYLKFDWAWPLSATDDRGGKFHFGLGTEY